jgi:dienelactone hydrolase
MKSFLIALRRHAQCGAAHGLRLAWLLALIILTGAAVVRGATRAAASATGSPAPPRAPAARIVDLRASDGTILRASYFAAAAPGRPGVLLLHQSNRPRKSWDDLARQLAAAGINTLTLDLRGFGDSAGKPYDQLKGKEWSQARDMWPGDIEAAWRFLVSQPGVQRDVIGLGGAGFDGVNNSVETARRHPSQVKSLVLLSGETLRPGLQFLRLASQLPELFVVSDDDEYPPTVEAMELLYLTASNSGKKLVHYVAKEAPWKWYEPFDIGRVPATGSHGTDMFKVHPELPAIIVDWLVTTLIKTPGRAPADTLASASVLTQIDMPGGAAKVAKQLAAARRRDPKAQLFPEVTVSIIGQDEMRAGEPQAALEIFKLNLLAYPDSADAHDNLAGAYLAVGQKALARQHAEKALALLDSHAAPASSWSDTEPQRGELRRSIQKKLEKLGHDKPN